MFLMKLCCDEESAAKSQKVQNYCDQKNGRGQNVGIVAETCLQGVFPHISPSSLSPFISLPEHTQTNIDKDTEKLTHTDVFGNIQINHSTTFSNTISELHPTRAAARNNAKYCLLTGQEQA